MIYSPLDEIVSVKGIGQVLAGKLNRLGIITVGDLLRHYPSRYIDFTTQLKIRELKNNHPASFLAKIGVPHIFYSKTQKLVIQAIAEDETGKIPITWFNNPYIKRVIKPGNQYSIAGTPSFFGPKLTIISPTIEEGDSFSINTKGYVPVYPQTAGITSRWLRKKIFDLINEIELKDPLNQTNLINSNELLALPQAIEKIHFPQSKNEKHLADKRLAYDVHLRINITNRLELKKLGPSVKVKISKTIDEKSAKKIPFTLTLDQEKVVNKIYFDLKQDDYTHRLIQGDTGSGKTATLLFAANQCLHSNFSCAVLAPTEILANQHAQTFRKLSLYPDRIVLITASSKTNIPEKPSIFIGTHALLNRLPNNLPYPLAFVAIDEQHKFGVKQREALLQRSPIPHVLNLSATPIPRTVALGLLGDIEISNILSKPTGRFATKTYVMTPSKFKNSPDWLASQLESGNQIFVVCPNISENDSGVSSVEKMTTIYRKMIPEKHPVLTIHGRMPRDKQVEVLKIFRDTPSSVLIATSLIEVGLDIPNANIMIIHSAERFGLAQLHQLRGRVGRGSAQGYCFLVPSKDDEVEIERLSMLKKYNSGLMLAKQDLRLRGAGEIFGIKQSGILPVKLRHFWSRSLFKLAKKDAIALINNNEQAALEIAGKLTTW